MKSIHRRGTHFLKSCSLSPNNKLQTSSWQIITNIFFFFSIRCYIWSISSENTSRIKLPKSITKYVYLPFTIFPQFFSSPFFLIFLHLRWTFPKNILPFLSYFNTFPQFFLLLFLKKSYSLVFVKFVSSILLKYKT